MQRAVLQEWTWKRRESGSFSPEAFSAHKKKPPPDILGRETLGHLREGEAPRPTFFME